MRGEGEGERGEWVIGKEEGVGVVGKNLPVRGAAKGMNPACRTAQCYWKE